MENMIKRYVCIVGILIFVTFIMIGFVCADQSNNKANKQNNGHDSKKVRVLAYTYEDFKSASNNGCIQIKENKKFRVYECDKKVLDKTSLTEDIQIFATDLAVDKQIGADKAWNVTIKNYNPLVNFSINMITSSSHMSVQINVTSPICVGANYTLYTKSSLSANQWTLVTSVKSTTNSVGFIQPAGNIMAFYKVTTDFSCAPDTGKGRKIVVLDTGYNYNHPDLKSSYLGGWDFVNNDSDPMDDNGHGSHVAGIIASDGIVDPNSKGVAPDVGIIAGKVLNENGTGYLSDVLNAIYWAVDNYHPDAISLSSGSSSTFTDYCDNIYPQFTAAVKYALDNNVSFVASSGNFGSQGVTFPGCINNSFTVGSINSSNKLASFSGMGKMVDITAPGVNVYSTWLDSSYQYQDGTSMSAPIISGVIALMKAKNQNASANEIQNKILSTATSLKIKGSTLGRINAYGAVNSI